MTTAIQPASALSQPGRPPLEKFLFAISAPARWAILSELSAGQPLIVLELAERLKRHPDTISKHMAALRKVGFVTVNRVGQYSIAPQFPVTPGDRQVDFGHALLRLAPVSCGLLPGRNGAVS